MVKRIHMILAVTAVAAAGLACTGGNTDADGNRSANMSGDRVTVPQADRQGVHNAANSLDWHGTYSGVLPCADCEGIATTLTLNADETYHLIMVYLGREDGEFHNRGTFSWNDAGNIVRLNGYEEGPGLYFVAENRLFHLDADGKRITGDLAGMYILEKQPAEPGTPLTGTRWVLDEIMGQPIVQRGDEQAPWFILSRDGNRIHGYGGCNTFNGTYELQEGGRISFSQIAATKMACLNRDVDYEPMVFEVLENADNYDHRGDMLTLNRAQMAPLSVWRAEHP